MKKNFFTFMPVDNGKSNYFDLSHTNSGSCNMGHLVPVYLEPTLPGDYFNVDISYLLRMAQMVAPPQSRIGTSFFAFYCPNRILMNSRDWDKFLADVDGTSGVSLPQLSFTPIYNYLRDSITLEDIASEVASIMLLDYSIDGDSVSFSYQGNSVEGTQSLSSVYTPEDLKLVQSRFDSLKVETVNIFGGAIFNLSKSIGFYPFKGTLLDYFGFPVNSPLMKNDGFYSLNYDSVTRVFNLNSIAKITSSIGFQVLPLIAYLYIWNEYFRQEYIQEEVDERVLTDFNNWKNLLNQDISIMWKLKRRDWEHDYYTSCLPAPQLGESSSISIGEDGKFTIPELREANVIQRIREKLLHGGSRVWEIVANFFSERLNDSRIQIPEFIRPDKGTGFSWLRISDIYQTAPGTSDNFPTLDASANLAAPRGASVNTNTGIRFRFSAPEHGYLMVLMNIQPEPVYCQGFPRHFMSLDTLDYGFPDFANITEQPVYQYEIYATPDNVRKVALDNPNASAVDYPIFGWQSQYAWYKFHQSELHGELRDDLDFFTFARIFDEEPHLNDEFLTCNPTDRPFPVQYEYDKITYHLALNVSVNRRLPYFGIPSLR